MQIVTTFFNNEQYYMNNFVHWYKTLWKPNRFIFFIGKKTIDSYNFESHNIKFFVETKDNIITLKYRSSNNTTDQWHNLKQVFFEILKNNFMTYPSLWVDCDDFIYCKDIDKAVHDKQFKVHFYEHVPLQSFNFNNNTLWSTQCYYYREQALGNTLPKHDNCPLYRLEVGKQCSHMGHLNNYCNNNYTVDDYPNICWHVGIYSKEHYLNSKHWLQTDINGPGITEQDRSSGILIEHFNKYYAKCNFDTFNLNLKERYML